MTVTAEGGTKIGPNFLGQKREWDCTQCEAKVDMITVGMTVVPFLAQLPEEEDESDEELLEDESDGV